MPDARIQTAGDVFQWITRTLGGQCHLPQDILLAMFCLLHHRNDTGLTRPSTTTIALETSMTETQVIHALRGAEQLKVITRHSLTVRGVVQWTLNVGHTPPPDQLHLRHAVTSRIRQLRGIEDRQQLLLEACLRIGYDWTTGEVVTTRRELTAELPRWSAYKVGVVFKELHRAGILTLISQGRRGGTGARHRLSLSAANRGVDSPPYQANRGVDEAPYSSNRGVDEAPYVAEQGGGRSPLFASRVPNPIFEGEKPGFEEEQSSEEERGDIELWNQALDVIRQKIPRPAYETVLADLQLMRIVEQTVYVMVSAEHAAARLEPYALIVEDALRKVSGVSHELEIVVDGNMT